MSLVSLKALAKATKLTVTQLHRSLRQHSQATVICLNPREDADRGKLDLIRVTPQDTLHEMAILNLQEKAKMVVKMDTSADSDSDSDEKPAPKMAAKKEVAVGPRVSNPDQVGGVFIGEADQKLAAVFMLSTKVDVFGAGVRASLHLLAPVWVVCDTTDPQGETAPSGCPPLQERGPYPW